jgi:hypothetical protein
MTPTQTTRRTLTAEAQRDEERTQRKPDTRFSLSVLSPVLCVSAVNVLLVLSLFLTACRSGPPPTPPGNTLAGRQQDVTGKYQGIVVVDGQCSSFAGKDDQIVCIANKGQDTVPIGKWLIRNTIGRTYYFPDGTMLGPGKTIKVHTGPGTNNATDLYWNYEFKPVFDAKDKITLVDNSNVEVANFTTP